MDEGGGIGIPWWVLATIACLMISDVLHRLTFRAIELRLDHLEGKHG